MNWLRRNRLPEAPHNARLLMLDGTQFHLELHYVGKDAYGLNVWRPTQKLPDIRQIEALLVDMLPARTTLQFEGTYDPI